MANDDFSEPPRRADSKNPIFIFCRFLGLCHLRGPGVSLGRIFRVPSIEPLLGCGGGLARGLYRPPPPIESPPAPEERIALEGPWTQSRPALFGPRLRELPKAFEGPRWTPAPPADEPCKAVMLHFSAPPPPTHTPPRPSTPGAGDFVVVWGPEWLWPSRSDRKVGFRHPRGGGGALAA